jgi:chloride channel protein, CIC family
LFNLSYGVSTPGGIFFPIVAFGAVSGLSFARTVERLFPALELDPGKCAVAGMAALLGATVRAPLTGLMLVIEMTGSYQLVVMSVLASIIADASAEFLGDRPIYEQLLDRTQGSNRVPSGSLPLTT